MSFFLRSKHNVFDSVSAMMVLLDSIQQRLARGEGSHPKDS